MSEATPVASGRHWWLEHLVALTAIVCATAAFSAPIDAVPDRMPAGHDYALAIALGEGFAQGLADGHVYPRWLSDANAGFGLPALVGYPPLSGAMVGVAKLVTGDTMAAFRAVILLINFLSGLAFFVFARRFARPSVAGIAAALYVLAPYHVVVVYHRFAFAEFSCAIWIPLVLHYGLSLRTRPSLGGALGLAASFAAVVLSHVVVAQMVVVAVGVVVLITSRPWRYPRRALTMAAALVGSLALAGAYVVPLLLSRDYVHWDAQYGSSRGVPFLFALRGDVFTSIVEVAFLVQAACLAPLLPLLRRTRNGALLTCIVAALWVTALHTAITYPVWRWLPGMEYLLYPYRFGLLASLFVPLAVVWGMDRRPALAALGALGCLAGLFALPTVLDQPRYVNLHEHPVVVWNQEHIPRSVGSIAQRGPMPERVVTSGNATAQIVEWRSHSRHFLVDVQDTQTRVRVATWYYPGWRAEIDGAPISVGPEAISGLIMFDLERGMHDVTLHFEDTLDRVVGKVVSGVAWLVFLVLVIVAIVRRRRARAVAGGAVR